MGCRGWFITRQQAEEPMGGFLERQAALWQKEKME